MDIMSRSYILIRPGCCTNERNKRENHSCDVGIILSCFTSSGESSGSGVGWFSFIHLKKLSMHPSFLHSS